MILLCLLSLFFFHLAHCSEYWDCLEGYLPYICIPAQLSEYFNIHDAVFKQSTEDLMHLLRF